MPTVNDKMQDLTIKHQIGLRRRGAMIAKEISEALKKTNPALERLLAKELRKLDRFGQSGHINDQVERVINSIMVKVGKLRGPAYKGLVKSLDLSMIELAQYEQQFQQTSITLMLPFLRDEIVTNNKKTLKPLIRGKAFPDNMPKKDRKNYLQWAGGLLGSEMRRINSTITGSFVEQKEAAQILTDVMGTRINGFKDGALFKSVNNIKSVAQTSTANTAQVARTAYYKSNRQLSKSEKWSAILDGRTTVICISRDGIVKPTGEWGKEYPAHYGERSAIIPVIDGQAIVNKRTAITDTRTPRTLRADFRADAKAKLGAKGWSGINEAERRALIKKQKEVWENKNIGRIPKETTGQQWLRQQSKDFQDDYFGPVRAKLFRTGKLSAGDLLDRNDSLFTLSQLADHNRSAFFAAGLDPDNF